MEPGTIQDTQKQSLDGGSHRKPKGTDNMEKKNATDKHGDVDINVKENNETPTASTNTSDGQESHEQETADTNSLNKNDNKTRIGNQEYETLSINDAENHEGSPSASSENKNCAGQNPSNTEDPNRADNNPGAPEISCGPNKSSDVQSQSNQDENKENTETITPKAEDCNAQISQVSNVQCSADTNSLNKNDNKTRIGNQEYETLSINDAENHEGSPSASSENKNCAGQRPSNPEDPNRADNNPGAPEISCGPNKSSDVQSQSNQDENKENTETITPKAEDCNAQISQVSNEQCSADTNSTDKGDAESMISKKERKTIPHTGKRLTIFCEAANIDIVFLIERMITDNIMKSCSSGRVVYFMDGRENEWKSVSIKSSVILFYGCMVANSLGDIDKSLEPIIKTYGTEHIIVVLGYANTTKSEKEIKAEWILSKSSCSKVICFTEQELDLISPSLKGPKTAARSMAYKVNYIRHILSKEPQHLGMESVKTKKKRKPTVRIFSWSKRKHSEWLRQLLISKRFLDQEPEVRYIYVPSPVDKSLEEKISCCTNIILYITSAQLGFKPEFLHLLDRDKVIAVIDNLDDSNTETLIKIKQTYPHIQRMSQELILFSREEKSSNYENYRTSLILAEKTLQEKMIQLEDLIKDTAPIENERLEVILKEPCISVSSISHRSIENHTVGIFSRSGQNNYSWILTLLESENFSHIKEIKPHCITNNGYLKFREAVSQCTFGILYHTKNHGRVNVTNVTDSLYDEELKHLSNELGKEKVIVIIDDLEDSSPEEKNRIMGYQPDIGNLAKELFIFSESEKTSYKINPGDLLIDSSIGEKFLRIKDLLQ